MSQKRILLNQKEIDLMNKRAQVASLYQFAQMPQEAIAVRLGVSPAFVNKWKDASDFSSKKRSGRPVSVLTEPNLIKLRTAKLKTAQSTRKLATKLKMGRNSVSRGMRSLGLKSYRRSKQSKLNGDHIEMRFETAENFKDYPPEYWEDYLITDEKTWCTNGMLNSQNDRIWAECAEDVPPLDMDKFPGKRMIWLGMSARGLTKPHWMKGKVNGDYYHEHILKKRVLNDVLKRKGRSPNITETKLFKSNARMIFEQDFAKPHSTNKNQAFMEKHFPNHTPTLHRYRGNHPYFFAPKMDDVWPIERLWAILAQKVYAEPRPKHIDHVVQRVRRAIKQVDSTTLTKLVHDIPAKLNEIYRLGGKKLPPNFDPRKSPFACQCKVCLS